LAGDVFMVVLRRDGSINRSVGKSLTATWWTGGECAALTPSP
jgi:hypothetical protein